MSKLAVLLVTCCLEPTRAQVLHQVLDNLREQAPELRSSLCVFDNASTEPGTEARLSGQYDHVFRADRNVGYWSAIDWWLSHIEAGQPDYTYIIESDMIHFNFNGIWTATAFLDRNPTVGAVRLHEYSVEHKHLYNKDAPVPGSRRSLWQSHTNKVTGEPVVLVPADPPIYLANFLTQLPALNRYVTMRRTFDTLRQMPHFSELDFQRMCHNEYPQNAIMDGGIFHCNLNPYGAPGITGSWTDPGTLQALGYQTTRTATIVPRDKYIVTKV